MTGYCDINYNKYEEYPNPGTCDRCEYENNCPYWVRVDLRDKCTGNRNDIEDFIMKREDEETELCATCEQEDGCKFRERKKCIEECL